MVYRSKARNYLVETAFDAYIVHNVDSFDQALLTHLVDNWNYSTEAAQQVASAPLWEVVNETLHKFGSILVYKLIDKLPIEYILRGNDQYKRLWL